MKIYTKTGDQGFTALLGGARVSKSNLRIEGYGTIDELNSFIGLLASYKVNEELKEFLTEIQRTLFTIGSRLAVTPGKPGLKLPEFQARQTETLEKEIDRMETMLSPLKHFILPGGSEEVAFCHIARTVCRRAERKIVALSEAEPVDNLIIIYLNRLSDYLFVLARYMSRKTGVKETPWKPDKIQG